MESIHEDNSLLRFFHLHDSSPTSYIIWFPFAFISLSCLENLHASFLSQIVSFSVLFLFFCRYLRSIPYELFSFRWIFSLLWSSSFNSTNEHPISWPKSFSLCCSFVSLFLVNTHRLDPYRILRRFEFQMFYISLFRFIIIRRSIN